MNPTLSPTSPASLTASTPRRPRREASFWRPILDRLAASGLTVAAFCDREDLPASSIYHWRRKLEAEPVDPNAPPRVTRLDRPATAVVPAPDAAASDPVVAELPNGVRLTADARHLVALLGVLAAC